MKLSAVAEKINCESAGNGGRSVAVILDVKIGASLA